MVRGFHHFSNEFFSLTSGALENEVIAKRSKLAFILAKIELVYQKICSIPTSHHGGIHLQSTLGGPGGDHRSATRSVLKNEKFRFWSRKVVQSSLKVRKMDSSSKIISE